MDSSGNRILQTHIARRKFHRFKFLRGGHLQHSVGSLFSMGSAMAVRYSGLPLQNHPQYFACLGMVVAFTELFISSGARAGEGLVVGGS